MTATRTTTARPPAQPGAGRTWSAARVVTFWVVLGLYLALTVLIILPSPVIDLDQKLYGLHLHVHHPSYYRLIYYFELFGQRGPATISFLPFFLWVCWRTRSTRPLVMLFTSLILLNLSVGIVKVVTSRLGPQQSRFAHEVFMGGDIYPSGHVSNVVVLYGIVAWTSLRFRKSAVAAAVFLSLGVSAGTVYLNTHWFSDLIAGLLAGAVVLLGLPTVLPTAQEWADEFVGWLGRRWRWVAWLDPTPRFEPAGSPVPPDALRDPAPPAPAG
ncbi:phosphatase PAP2 family protein [uncultured Jatrophihabitans sp.]|uniref:phosphatase PAP2 family protein n=1 Tax=uncultured Jatrophihabitans sp. TaxID=1610747 RepID=UPI0035CB6CFD